MLIVFYENEFDFKCIFVWMVSHEDSFPHRGKGRMGNGI